MPVLNKLKDLKERISLEKKKFDYNNSTNKSLKEFKEISKLIDQNKWEETEDYFRKLEKELDKNESLGNEIMDIYEKKSQDLEDMMNDKMDSLFQDSDKEDTSFFDEEVEKLINSHK